VKAGLGNVPREARHENMTSSESLRRVHLSMVRPIVVVQTTSRGSHHHVDVKQPSSILFDTNDACVTGWWHDEVGEARQPTLTDNWEFKLLETKLNDECFVVSCDDGVAIESLEWDGGSSAANELGGSGVTFCLSSGGLLEEPGKRGGGCLGDDVPNHIGMRFMPMRKGDADIVACLGELNKRVWDGAVLRALGEEEEEKEGKRKPRRGNC
jgi:hypothetical protein